MSEGNEKAVLIFFIIALFALNKSKNGNGNGNNSNVNCNGDKSFLDVKDVAALRNNNPGNLIRTASKFAGEIESTGSFRRFACWKYGTRAMIKNLQGSYYFGKGDRTITEIIKVWAPLGGSLPNSTTAQNNYINFVASKLKVSKDAKLIASKHNLRLLVKAMSEFEAGKAIVTDEDFETAWSIL